MRVTRIIAVTIIVASAGLTGLTALNAQTLRNASPPAEFPTAAFKGKQFVDSRGCIYIRAGIDGNVTWVPRVNRQRKQICGYQPTATPSVQANAPQRQQGKAPVQITVAPEGSPAEKSAPATQQAAATRPTAPAASPKASAVRKPSPAPAATVVRAPPVPNSAAPKPAASAPASVPASATAAATRRKPSPSPAPTVALGRKPATKPSVAPAAAAPAKTPPAARTAARKPSSAPAPAPTVALGRKAPGKPVTPAATAPVTVRTPTPVPANAPSPAPQPTIAKSPAPPKVAASAPAPLQQAQTQATAGNPGLAASQLPVNTRTVPRHVADNRQNTTNVRVPAGYHAVWDDDRLNPRRAEQTLRPTIVRDAVVVPRGYKVVDWEDDRLNIHRGATAAGDAQSDLIWTNTVPRRLVPVRAQGQVVTVEGRTRTQSFSLFAQVPEQPRTTQSGGTTRVSTRSAPALTDTAQRYGTRIASAGSDR